RRRRVPAVGARAARPHGRALTRRHHDRRLGPGRAARGGARGADPFAPAPRGALSMRRLAALLTVVLVGAPLLIAPSTAVVALGTAAMLLCGLGIVVATQVLVAGMVVA